MTYPWSALWYYSVKSDFWSLLWKIFVIRFEISASHENSNIEIPSIIYVILIFSMENNFYFIVCNSIYVLVLGWWCHVDSELYWQYFGEPYYSLSVWSDCPIICDNCTMCPKFGHRAKVNTSRELKFLGNLYGSCGLVNTIVPILGNKFHCSDF
jgi:hypothetical protein